MVELALRIGRCERALRLDTDALPRVTFPGPDHSIERCSCEESIMLRARVRELEAAITRLAVTE